MLRVGPRVDKWLGTIPSTDKKDPRPFLMPGVRVQFAPVALPAVRAGKAAGSKVLSAEGDAEEIGDAYSYEVIRRGIVAWEGVVDDATEVPIPVTPETVELVLADPDFFAAADRAYVLPFARQSAEKNGFAVSPNGTGGAATGASATASKRAARRTASAAKNAPTPSKRRKPTPAKKSGGS